MLTIVGWILFFVALMLSIGLHEIGHLLPAKKFGVRVTQYMVGFGPTLWSRKRGETEYGVKAIPLGGYIRMIGMFPPNPRGPVDPKHMTRMQALVENLRAESLAEIRDGEEHRAFYNLGVAKKLLVMSGGPLMNLLIAIVLFGVAFCGIGNGQISTTVSSVVPCVPTSANPQGMLSTDSQCHGSEETAAHRMGLAAGDEIVTIDDKAITVWSDLGKVVSPLHGQTVDVVYRHNGQEIQRSVVIPTLTESELDDQGQPTGKTITRGFLGVSPQIVAVRQPLSQLLPEVGSAIVSAVKSLAQFPMQVFNTGQTLVSDGDRDPNGPVSIVGIGQITGQITSSDVVPTWLKTHDFIVMIASVNLFLFVFNGVPILPLDGGHIAGAVYEGARRGVARIRGKARPGPVDTARMWPIAYFVTIMLIVVSLITVLADIFKPIS